MNLIYKALEKYKQVPEKIHGSLSFNSSSNNSSILDFSSSCLNLNLKEIARSYINSNDISQYPDPDAKELKSVLAQVLKISDENILITNGSSEALFLLGLAFCSNNSRVLIPEITYGEYERVAKIFSSKIEKIRLLESENFEISNLALEKALGNQRDIVFLCNPNNPTGHYMDSSILKLFKNHPETLFVLDEAYIDFLENPWFSLKALDFQNVAILRSFTKTHGLAGLRLGYLVASKKIIRLLDSLKNPWNINYLSVQLAIHLIKDTDICKREIAHHIEGKELLVNYFKKKNLVIPSQTNYFLLKVKNSKLICENFLKKNILVRECNSFGLKNYIRINSRKSRDCKVFLEVFEDIKGECDE